MWFQKFYEFINESRDHNYKKCETIFPSPICESQDQTNFFVFVLYVLNILGDLELLAVATITPVYLKPIILRGFLCFGTNENHRDLVLDLCFQLAFRPTKKDHLNSLNILMDMFNSEVFLKNLDMC